MEQVKLFGAWPSPYVYRAIWALEMKGIKYEYIQEDLANKSDELLKYNPIEKKVPVLVHNGRPIIDSIVILEYIEETWPQNPLLSKHPYERAQTRFWINFIKQKEIVLGAFYLSVGEEIEKAANDVKEFLRIVEDDALGGETESTFLGGDEIGMADLVMGVIAKSLGVIEQVVGHKVLEENEFPRIIKWIKNFRQHNVIKNNLPCCDQMLDYYKKKKDLFLAAKAV